MIFLLALFSGTISGYPTSVLIVLGTILLAVAELQEGQLRLQAELEKSTAALARLQNILSGIEHDPKPLVVERRGDLASENDVAEFLDSPPQS